MSAICGVIHTDGQAANFQQGKEMMNKLKLYKLDSEDTYIKEEVFFGCGLQYITTESKREKLPFFNKDKGLLITADAIIDNRTELFQLLNVAEDLKGSLTDSELILLAYEKWKENCPKFLLGDFAFAIWDERSRTLFCARDHVGKRTFYYSYRNNIFAFSTVIKPIFLAFNVPIELNEKWITDFLALPGAIHELGCEETVYKDIFQLPPASSMSLKNDHLKIVQYWNPFETPLLKLKSDKEYEEAFQKVFSEAVKCRLRSFGDIGISLSGGLDSGTVASIAARQLVGMNKSLKAFTSIPLEGYKDYLPKYQVADEREYIEAIREYSGNIDITYCRNDGKNSVSDIDFILNVLEQPYKIIENMFWYNGTAEEAAKCGCKVLLDGQFGNFTVSYGDFFTNIVTLYRKGRILRLMKEVEAFHKLHEVSKIKVRKAAFRAILPYNFRRIISKRVNKNNEEFFQIPINKKQKEKWNVDKRFKEEGYNLRPERFYSIDEARKRMLNPAIFTHIGAVETKVSLAHGIVKRDPTRDKRVIEFCLSLPPEQFVRNGEERYLIRKYMKGILPDKVRLNREKRGLQSADWIQRLQPDWENIHNELLKALEDESIKSYVNVVKLKEQLNNKIDFIDEKHGTKVRMFLILLIFSHFMKTYNV